MEVEDVDESRRRSLYGGIVGEKAMGAAPWQKAPLTAPLYCWRRVWKTEAWQMISDIWNTVLSWVKIRTEIYCWRFLPPSFWRWDIVFIRRMEIMITGLNWMDYLTAIYASPFRSKMRPRIFFVSAAVGVKGGRWIELLFIRRRISNCLCRRYHRRRFFFSAWNENWMRVQHQNPWIKWIFGTNADTKEWNSGLTLE